MTFLVHTQWGISPTAISGGSVTPLGVTGPSALDGDVDQAMLNLALDAPAPVSISRVHVHKCIMRVCMLVVQVHWPVLGLYMYVCMNAYPLPLHTHYAGLCARRTKPRVFDLRVRVHTCIHTPLHSYMF
jgi:hypothetical protein